MQYADHPEHKLDENAGFLRRRHIKASEIAYIGKEANSIEEQALEVQRAQVFIKQSGALQRVPQMPQKDAEQRGVKGRGDFKTHQRTRYGGARALIAPYEGGAAVVGAICKVSAG